MKRIIRVLTMTSALTLLNVFNSFAGWEQIGEQWKYKDDSTGIYLINGWNWLDGNNDGISECYYLDGLGIMSLNTIVDGYSVNEQGQWVVDGVIQTKVKESPQHQSNVNNNINNGTWDASGTAFFEDPNSVGGTIIDNECYN